MTPSSTPCLIYGANGYTGALITRTAVEHGLRPLVAGRNRAAITSLAQQHDLDYRIFALEDTAALEAALREVQVVLLCAGPFAHTAERVASACLRTATQYMDITGEIAVFEALAGHDQAAKAAGVMLLPGAGFDVVPSDCLAAHLKRRLPTAQRLTLAFQSLSGVSRGTATTAIESIGQGGMVRRDGALRAVPPGHRTRMIDFGRGPVRTVAIPWGDVATAYYSTSIPNIEVYMALPRAARWLMVASRPLAPLLRSYAAQRILKRLIHMLPPGPGDVERARGMSLLWGAVEDAAGRRCVARMRTPEAYALTTHTALVIVERVLHGHAPAGFQTPSLAYGPDFVLEIDGVMREDIV